MENTEKISVLIAESQALIRESWVRLINESDDFRSVGQCSHGEEVLAAVKDYLPEIIMMDINLPRFNGIEATRVIGKKIPSAKVLCMSYHFESADLVNILKAGAFGYISKNSTVQELFFALTEIHNGRKYIGDDITQQMARDYYMRSTNTAVNNLSRKEAIIAGLIEQGFSSQAIAAELSLSVNTIGNYRRSIAKKMKAITLHSQIEFSELLNPVTRTFYE